MSSYGQSINATTYVSTESDKPECAKGRNYSDTELILREGEIPE